MRFFLVYIALFFSLMRLCGQQTNSFSDYLAKPTTYNIFFSCAQISDIHLYDGNQKSCTNLNAIVEEINNNNDIAFVIVSGDITEYGDYNSLLKVKSILSRLRCPYYVIPGNNDYELSMVSGEYFKKVFDDNKFRLLFNGYLFLGINSSSPYRWSEGFLSTQDVIWVKQQLKNVGKKTPVFIITHHPLKNGDVINWFNLTDEIRKYNIQSIISGHYHRNMVNDYDGISGFVSKALLSKDSTLGYTIYQLTDDSLFVLDKLLNHEPILWASQEIKQKFYVESNSLAFPRPNFDVNSSYKVVKEKWHKPINFDIYTSAINDDLNVYFCDSRGNFRCFALKNGKELWSIHVGGTVYQMSDLVNDKVIFCASDNVFCVDVKLKKILWKVTTKSQMLAKPVVANGIVYIVGGDDIIRAMSLNSGELIWNKRIPLINQNKPSVYNGVVYVGSLDGNIHAMRASDGDLLWNTIFNNDIIGKPYSIDRCAESGLYPIGNKLFYVTLGGKLKALDLYTGNILWQTNDLNLLQSTGVSNDNTILYCRSSDGNVLAINTQSDEFAILAQIEDVYSKDSNISNIVSDDNFLFITTYDGEVICLDIVKKLVLWKHKVGYSAVNSVSIVDAHSCVVTTLSGDIVMLNY